MAFSSAIITEGQTIFGNKKVVMGTYTNGSGDIGGDVATGLERVDAFFIQPGGASAIATASTVNETLPLSGGDVTIVTADNEDGTWIAIGV